MPSRSGVVDLPTYRRLPSEAAMEEAIRELVALKGGRSWHVRDSRNAPEMVDFPDLAILLPPYAMQLEVKSQRRIVTDGQKEVAGLLKACTRFVGGIVRPDPMKGEWAYDDILDFLRKMDGGPIR